MNSEHSNSAPGQPCAPRAAIRVIGAGNAGVQLVEMLRALELPDTGYAAVNSDKPSLAASGAAEKLEIPARLLGGHGHRSEPGKTELDAQEAALQPLCHGAEILALVAGLGGRAGTQLMLSLARTGKKAGAMVLAFVTMPLDCEGSVRYSKARQGLERLRAVADIVFCLPHQEVAGHIDESTSLADTYAVPAHLLVDCVCTVLRATRTSPLMGLAFGDVCALLKERHAETAFAVAEAEGADRAADLVKKLLEHPLLRGGKLLAGTDSISISVVGGPDLRVADVNRIMQQLGRHNSGAPVVMGAGICPALTGRLAAVMLVTTPARSDHHALKEQPGAEIGAGTFDEHFVPRDGTGGRGKQVPPTHARPMAADVLPPGNGRSAASNSRRAASRLRQTQLPLDLAGKGRFEKSEPNIHKGEDLDQPTFIRRGISLN